MLLETVRNYTNLHFFENFSLILEQEEKYSNSENAEKFRNFQ